MTRSLSIPLLVALAGAAAAQTCPTVPPCNPCPPAQCNITPPAGPLVVRVEVKRVLGPNGTSPWSPTTITSMMNAASTYLSGLANVSLQILPTVDIVDPGVPQYFDAASNLYSWYDVSPLAMPEMESAAEADPERFGWNPDAINIYLVNSFCGLGGLAAYPPGTFGPSLWNELMVFPPGFGGSTTDQRAATMVHELAHYFDLFHTHDAFGPAACPPNHGCPGTCGNAACSGDFVADTPFDPWPAAPSTIYAAGGCNNPAAIALLQNNLMSYQMPSYSTAFTLTAGQVARLRCRLWQTRQHVVATVTPPSIATVTPSSQVSPGPTQLTITGSGLPTSGFVVQAGRPLCTSAVTQLCPCIGCTFGSSTACVAEATSNSVVSATTTSITVGFPAPIPPGRHTVSIRQANGGRVIVQAVDALAVTPYLETVPDPVGGTAFTVRAVSSAPMTPLIVGVGSLSPFGLPVPGAVGPFWISLVSSPPPTFLGGLVPGYPSIPAPQVTDGAGQITYPISLLSLPLDSLTAVQAIELVGGGRFTNPLLMTRP